MRIRPLRFLPFITTGETGEQITHPFPFNYTWVRDFPSIESVPCRIVTNEEGLTKDFDIFHLREFQHRLLPRITEELH